MAATNDTTVTCHVCSIRLPYSARAEDETGPEDHEWAADTDVGGYGRPICGECNWHRDRILSGDHSNAINALRDEAGSAGDMAQVAFCDRALADLGDTEAVNECARVLVEGDRFRAEAHGWSVGDRVEGGDIPEDYDTGKVVKVEGDLVYVSWDGSPGMSAQSGSLLRREGERVVRGR